MDMSAASQLVDDWESRHGKHCPISTNSTNASERKIKPEREREERGRQRGREIERGRERGREEEREKQTDTVIFTLTSPACLEACVSPAGDST